MTCGERRTTLFLYAAGVLEPDERQALEAHLQTGCPRCTGTLAEAKATLAQFWLWLEPVDMSQAVKRRLMQRLATRPPSEFAAASPHPGATAPLTPPQALESPAPPEPPPPPGDPPNTTGPPGPPDPPRRRSHTLSLFAAAVLSLCAVAFALVQSHEYRQEIRRLRGQLAQSVPATSPRTVQEAVDIGADLLRTLQSSALQVISLTDVEASDNGRSARLLMDRERKVCHVVAPALSPAEAGKTYRLWLITEDGRYIAAGTFDVSQRGAGRFDVGLPESLSGIAQACISYGAAAESPSQPTPILRGAFTP